MKLASDLINKIRINSSQFAMSHSILIISEWPFVLFSKIANDQKLVEIHSAVSAIFSPSYFLLETFSWSFLSMEMYAWRHTLHLKKVFSQNRKNFSLVGKFCTVLLPNLLLPNANWLIYQGVTLMQVSNYQDISQKYVWNKLPSLSDDIKG